MIAGKSEAVCPSEHSTCHTSPCSWRSHPTTIFGIWPDVDEPQLPYSRDVFIQGVRRSLYPKAGRYRVAIENGVSYLLVDEAADSLPSDLGAGRSAARTTLVNVQRRHCQPRATEFSQLPTLSRWHNPAYPDSV